MMNFLSTRILIVRCIRKISTIALYSDQENDAMHIVLPAQVVFRKTDKNTMTCNIYKKDVVNLIISVYTREVRERYEICRQLQHGKHRI